MSAPAPKSGRTRQRFEPQMDDFYCLDPAFDEDDDALPSNICKFCGRNNEGHEGEPCDPDCPQYD